MEHQPVDQHQPVHVVLRASRLHADRRRLGRHAQRPAERQRVVALGVDGEPSALWLQGPLHLRRQRPHGRQHQVWRRQPLRLVPRPVGQVDHQRRVVHEVGLRGRHAARRPPVVGHRRPTAVEQLSLLQPPQHRHLRLYGYVGRRAQQHPADRPEVGAHHVAQLGLRPGAERGTLHRYARPLPQAHQRHALPQPGHLEHVGLHVAQLQECRRDGQRRMGADAGTEQVYQDQEVRRVGVGQLCQQQEHHQRAGPGDPGPIQQRDQLQQCLIVPHPSAGGQLHRLHLRLPLQGGLQLQLR